MAGRKQDGIWDKRRGKHHVSQEKNLMKQAEVSTNVDPLACWTVETGEASLPRNANFKMLKCTKKETND